MIYRCKKCNKFLANIESEKIFKITGKKIEFTEKEIIIKCRCGKVERIKKGT